MLIIHYFFRNFAAESRLHITSEISAKTNCLISISEKSVYLSNYQPQPEIKKCTLKMYPEYETNNVNN